MSLQGFLLVCLAAVSTMVSNLMLREGVRRAGGFGLSMSSFISNITKLLQQPLFDVGLVFYAAAAFVWFRVISTEDLSTSYPILVGLTFILVTLGAVMLFHEPCSLLKIIGLVAILFGIILTFRG